MTMLTIIVATVAMAWFGLATPLHHERRTARILSPARRRRLRTAAWSAVVTAFALAVAGRGWVFGPPLWAGALMSGAGAVFLALNLLPMRERQERPQGRIIGAHRFSLSARPDRHSGFPSGLMSDS